jgi:hypothetical protein
LKIITLIPATSAAVDMQSAAFDMGDLVSGSVEVDFTGSDVVGTLTLECRNTELAAWKTVASSSQPITASGDHIWIITGSAGYRYLRVAWDWTSGTGNISSTLLAKEMRVVGV